MSSAIQRRGLSSSIKSFLAVLLVLGVVPILPSSAAVQPSSMSAASLNTLWNNYGNQGGHWTGADSTVSVPLPDGRIAWLFSDTFLGTVNADFSRPSTSPMVHNTVVTQAASGLTQTLHGGTPGAPTSLVDTGDPNELYWVADATVAGSTLKAFYNRYHKTGSGPLDVELAGTALVTFALPALTLTSVQPLPLGNRIAWGSAILEDADYTYVYGTESAGGLKFAHIARLSPGLTGGWQFRTATGWSASELDSTRLMSGVGSAFSVERIAGQYVLLTQDTNLAFGPSVVAYAASAPTGPFGEPRYLLDAPEPAANRLHHIYDVHAHQELAEPGKILLSYNVNTLRSAETFADARIYRPRFVDVPWPFPVPDPTAVPGRPTALAIEGDGSPIKLSWQAPTTGASGYRVYRRDVTAGQTNFSRGWPVTDTTVEADFLLDSHTYEFRVTATNTAGESVPSDTRTVTIHVTAPPAPTNLRATPNTVGGVDLEWNPVPGLVHYQVYLRDLTAQETDFRQVFLPDPAVTRFTVTDLANDHEYELKVTASNGGGTGPASATVRATAHINPPVAPTGLRAVVNGDGSVQLDWQSLGASVWYWLYQRDVTAAEANFRKLTYPVTEGPTARPGLLQDGHEYEFKVSGINGGGEGPASAPIRITARFDKPGVPTNLRATANTDGSVSLEWTAPAPDLWYWIYQRDVTAGQTTLTRLDYPVTQGASARPGDLQNGDEYEFAVAAINAGGEGPRSATVRATARVDRPGAPTNLRATANGDGSIGLEWTAPGPNLWYWVYQRDVTAGESTATKLEYPVTQGTSTRPGFLTAGHEYEFTVTGLNRAGEGPSSAPARATARYDKPGAPTDPHATPGDGQVTLSWTAPAADAWYWVYLRDVTEGQTTFVRSEYPVTTGTTATLGWLTNGHDYEFKISAINAGGEGPMSTAVTARPMPVRPAKVAGLTATANDAGGVELRWIEPAPNLYYWVYQRDITAGESTFTKLPYPASGSSTVLGLLTNGHRYEFTVAGTNLAGDGPTADPAQATARYAPPTAPTNLRGQTSGNGTVDLAWDGPSPNLYYWVYWRDVTAGQTTFTKAQFPASKPSATIGPLLNGHVYEFKVTAENVGGEGPASATIQVTALGGLPQPPSALTATAGDKEVRLSWTASPSSGVMYWVYFRDTAGGQGFTRLQYPASGTTATVSPLENGHWYEFKVTAVNGSGDSEPSNVVSARPMPPAPTAPTGLSAIAGDRLVGLGWTANPTAETYRVYFRDTSAGQTSWTRVPGDIREWWFTVRSLSNGHRYEFRVTSVNLIGESSPSAVVSAMPVPPPPEAPYALTAVAGNGQVSLSWDASPTPNVYYWVYFKPEGQTNWYYFPNPVYGTSYVARNLPNNFWYEFKVTAANLGGQSPYSNTVSARPFYPPPAAPSGLTASAGDGYVVLNWNASPTPGVQYWVYFRPQGQANFYYFQTPVTGTRYVAAPLLNFFTYEFKVTAANPGGQSGFSNTVSARPFIPLPAPPSGLWAYPGDGQVTLFWNASPTPNVNYWVYFKPWGQNTWWYVNHPVSGTSYTFTGLWNGYPIEFKVTAANVVGQSGFSNTVSAVPIGPPSISNLRADVDVGTDTGPSGIWLRWSWGYQPSYPPYFIIQYRLTGAARWEEVQATVYNSPVWLSMPGWIKGRSYDFRVIAINEGGEAVSNIASATPLRSRYDVWYSFTAANWASNNDFWGAINHQGWWWQYGFDWVSDGCSGAPDNPNGFNFLPGCIRHDFGYRNHDIVGQNGNEYGRLRVDDTLKWDLTNVCYGESGDRRITCLNWVGLFYYVVRRVSRW